MIGYALLEILYAFVFALSSPIRLLGDVSLPANVANAISIGNAYLGAAAIFLPVNTLLAVFGSVLVVEGFIFGYKLVMWVKQLFW
jgi:hypothetical protein